MQNAECRMNYTDRFALFKMTVKICFNSTQSVSRLLPSASVKYSVSVNNLIQYSVSVASL